MSMPVRVPGAGGRLPIGSPWVALLGLTLPVPALAASASSFLAPAGPVAAQQYHHLIQVVVLSLIVVLPVIVGVPLLAWRYRQGNRKASYKPHWEFSHALEWAMWSVPTIIVLVLSVLLWKNIQALDPYKQISGDKAPVQVEVVGLDWKWLFIYPRYHIASVGELVFPQERPLSMKLTTDTVMQSFLVPSLGSQVYAMAGMVTQLKLKSDRRGPFEGMNTQYNGDGFDKQHFTAHAVSKAAFNQWVARVQKDGVALNPRAYRRLARSSTPAQVHRTFANRAMPARVTWFNNVAPDLFQGIVRRYVKGEAVKPADQPGAVAYDAHLAHSLSDHSEKE